jgi:hypothetical protein
VVAAIAVGAATSSCEFPPVAGSYPSSDASASSIAVGPSPLRRLSDAEYLNALQDLFPRLSPTLPALPPDVPVAGFDNAAEAQEPSDVLISRYEAIANLYAAAATADTPSVSALVGCGDWSMPALAASCAAAFIDATGRRLFRRPLAGDEHARFLADFQSWAAAVDFPAAAELTLSVMLQSPQFLYRPEPVAATIAAGSIVPVEPHALATRLSFFLWESVPDDALLDAADAGALLSDDQIRAQAARMLADPRAGRVLWSFPRQWLGLDQIVLPEHASRTPEVDAQWTAATQASAYVETERFVENVLGAGGTLRDLLTSPQAWVDGEMSRVYGLPAPADPTAWTETTLPEGERAGVLTRVSFLASTSHQGATSPPVRGNAIELRLLCELPLAPPPGVDISQPTAPAGSGPVTNRTLFEQRTAPTYCQACHASLNGFGFGFEEYDAAGHFRTTDDGLPVDATGTITGTDVDGPFDGAIDLSRKLAGSQIVHACATQELVRYALGRAPVAAEAPTVAALAQTFFASGGDLRALLAAIVMTPTFREQLVGGN